MPCAAHPLPPRAAVLVAAATLLGLAACSTTQTPVTQVEDTAIKAEVLALIAADPELSPREIGVEVNEGVVCLTGMVDERGAARRAEGVAARASGVRQVVNYLTIGEQTLRERADDGGITARVKAALAQEMNPFNVNVTTIDGVVHLTGRVPSAEHKAQAERLARGVAGVREVRNDVEVGADI